MVEKNINTTGRVIRFLFGLMFLFLAWWYASWILLAAALFCFYEALFSWCVFYQIMGWNSCPLDKR